MLDMKNMTGISKRQVTLLQWREQLEKAENRLNESFQCFMAYKDFDSKQRMQEDMQKVQEIEKEINEVVAYMDEHNIQ